MHFLNRQTTAIPLPKLFCGSEIYMDRAISIIIIVISPVILPKNDYVSKRKNKHRNRKFPESSKKSLTGSRRRLNNFQSDNDQSDVVVLFWFEMFQGSQVARDLARSVNLKSRNFFEFCLLISLLFTLIICEPCWIFDKIKSHPSPKVPSSPTSIRFFIASLWSIHPECPARGCPRMSNTPCLPCLYNRRFPTSTIKQTPATPGFMNNVYVRRKGWCSGK